MGLIIYQGWAGNTMQLKDIQNQCVNMGESIIRPFMATRGKTYKRKNSFHFQDLLSKQTTSACFKKESQLEL